MRRKSRVVGQPHFGSAYLPQLQQVSAVADEPARWLMTEIDDRCSELAAKRRSILPAYFTDDGQAKMIIRCICDDHYSETVFLSPEFGTTFEREREVSVLFIF